MEEPTATTWQTAANHVLKKALMVVVTVEDVTGASGFSRIL